jgi:tetratricopeptide (TPR) repeat protein
VLALSLSLNAAAIAAGAGNNRSAQDVNQAVVAARAASKDKRYADAEALMLKATADNPTLIVPRVELGLAQLNLKKLPEAEASFKIALGIDPAATRASHQDDFYQEGNSAEGEGTHLSRNTMGGAVIAPQTRTPELKGICLSSLGEIYIRTKRFDAGQRAFDDAAKANPSQAALYLRNETIFFYQVGNAQGELVAADKALAVDPNRAMLYFFKGQAIAAAQAPADPDADKKPLPQASVDAYKKYLALEPNGQFAALANKALASGGTP